jgi:hypothetical protein
VGCRQSEQDHPCGETKSFNMMTLIQDTQRDASQQAIARWENEGGA